MQHHTAKPSAASYALPSFKSSFANEASFPLPSRYDASALYDGASTHFREEHSYSSPDVAMHHSTFYDSEEEDGQEDGAEFWSEGDARATFFSTSAERGQWRYDPIPVRLHARSEMRKSLPTWSPPALPGLQLVTRPISEPAPSSSSPLYPSDEHEDASEFTFPMSSDQQAFMCDTRQSLPSLMSDRDTSPEQEEMQPSSPLPPSSPPLSHASFPHSPIARSISPLSFAPSSPPPVSSSPLTFGSSEDHDDLDDETGVSVDHPEVGPTTGSPPTAAQASETSQEIIYPPIAHDPDTGVPSSSPSAIALSSSPQNFEVSVVTTEIQPIPVTLEETSNSCLIHSMLQDVPTEEFCASPNDESSNIMHRRMDLPDRDLETVTEASKQTLKSDDEVLAEHVPLTDSDGDIRSDNAEGEATATDATLHKQDTDDVPISDASTNVDSCHVKNAVKEKRKKQMKDTLHDGPPRKKARVRVAEKTRTTSKREGKRKSEDEPDVGVSVPLVKKQRKGERDVASEMRTSPSRSVVSTSTSKPPSSFHEPRSSKPKLLDTDTPELDAEITGMLIECMATSRASSLPISSLYKSVMECRPSLKAQHTEKEWVTVFKRVLRNGVAGSGVFGKVESSGKDDSDYPLEAQWFYVPERDSDQERASLIRSMMPRPAKRTETKKYKQYYYRPLEKISRWDAEDDI